MPLQPSLIPAERWFFCAQFLSNDTKKGREPFGRDLQRLKKSVVYLLYDHHDPRMIAEPSFLVMTPEITNGEFLGEEGR